MGELARESARELPPLYACHACKRIGPPAIAYAHQVATGHPQDRIDDDRAAAVRDIWRREGRSLVDGGPVDE